MSLPLHSQIKIHDKDKQNSYTESSYSKLESIAAEHSTEIAVVKIFWGKRFLIRYENLKWY